MHISHCKPILPYLLLFIFVLLFFYPVFWGKVLIFSDNLNHLAPMGAFFAQEIKNLRLPLWNPYQFAGQPYWADPAQTVFSPFNLAYLLVANPFVATTLACISAIIFMSWGSYYFARVVGFSTLVSLIFALTFTFSGSSIESFNDLNSLVAISFIPWVLAFFYRDILGKKTWSLPMIACLSLQLFSGHTQYFYYTVGVMGGWVITYPSPPLSGRGQEFRGKLKQIFKKILGKFFPFVFSLFLVLGLTCVQWLPTVELLQQVHRTENVSYESRVGLQPVEFAKFIFPGIFGSLVGGTSWGPGSLPDTGFGHLDGYVSLFSLVVILLVFHFAYKNLSYFWIGVAVLSLTLSLGNQTLIYKFFFDYFPGFNFFRSPNRILILYSFAMAFLSAQSLSFLFQVDLKKHMSKIRLSFFLSLFFFLSFLLIRVQFLSFFASLFSIAYRLTKHADLATSASYTQEKLEIISALLGSSLVMILGITSIFSLLFSVRSKISSFLFSSLFLVSITTELFVISRGSLFFAPKEKLIPNPKIVQFLQENLGNERMISTSDTQEYTGLFVYHGHLTTRPPFSKVEITERELQDWQYLQQQMDMLPANISNMYGLKSTAGYVSVMPKKYREFTGSKWTNTLQFKDFSNPILDEFATKYIVSGVPKDFLKDSDPKHFQRVFEDGGISIYENLHAKPWVELQNGDINRRIEIISQNPTNIVFHITTSKPGDFIIRNLSYPGWVAMVNGKVFSLKEYKGIFQMVSVPAGESEVEIFYQPWSVWLGGIISGVFLLGVGGYFWAKKYLTFYIFHFFTSDFEQAQRYRSEVN